MASPSATSHQRRSSADPYSDKEDGAYSPMPYRPEEPGAVAVVDPVALDMYENSLPTTI
jgi:hypothetical protein